MAEGARLESVYTATYRGFESLPHRHIQRKSLYASTGFFVLYRAAPGGMRNLDPGSTTGAARGTVCEPRELTARRVRPNGPNQSLPHRHIQRKSLYTSTGFFAFISRQENGRCAPLTCPTKPSVGWVSTGAPTIRLQRQVRSAYLPYKTCRSVGQRKRTHLPAAKKPQR